jgi:hypothetical protein
MGDVFAAVDVSTALTGVTAVAVGAVAVYLVIAGLGIAKRALGKA